MEIGIAHARRLWRVGVVAGERAVAAVVDVKGRELSSSSSPLPFFTALLDLICEVPKWIYIRSS